MRQNLFDHMPRSMLSIQILAALSIGVIVIILAPSSALAQKNKTAYKYSLTDLLGFPDQGYQSRAIHITNRDHLEGALVLGTSRLFPDPNGPAIFHPALWHISASGTFPATDPVDLGLPAWSREVSSNGLNRFGMSVGNTIWANTQDANGNWVSPAFVDVPGLRYQELVGGVNRNTQAQAINNAGDIVGTVEVADPSQPSGLRIEGALWRLNIDGSVSDPVSLGNFYPYDVNNHGVIAGTTFEGYPAIGWIVDDQLVLEPMPASPRFFGAWVHAVNDCPIGDPQLTVVGDSFRNEADQFDADDSNRGVAWRPYDAARPTTVLGTLGGRSSTALDVNRRGDIVGMAYTKRGEEHAFVYAQGTMTDLNLVANVGNKTLQFAYGTNDNGDIVGSMMIPRPVSEQRGYLLRPISP